MTVSQVFQSISNPLTSAGLLLQALVRELDDIRGRFDDRGVHRAVRTVEVLQMTFAELQDMARVAANLASEQEDGPVQVDGPLSLAIQLARPKLAGRAAIVADLNEPPAVNASPNRLCQAFVGLIVQAERMLGDSSESGAMLRVTSREERSHTLVEVALTGPCVARRALPDGLNDDDLDDSESGSVGLALAGLLAAELGGMLSTDSEPGVGVWLRLRLPAN